MPEGDLQESRRLRRQGHDLALSGPAADPHLDLIALAQLVEGLRLLAVLVRKFDELEDVGGHGDTFVSIWGARDYLQYLKSGDLAIGFRGDWTMAAFKERAIDQIRAQVGK